MTLSMLEKLFSLKDKVVVITGAGGSIAGEIAKTAALCGAKVALLDINLKAALDRTDELAKLGHEVIALECDVLSKASMEKSCDQIVKHFHKINCLINGAGGNKREATTSEDLSFFDIPIEANKWVFDLNFMGTLLPCQVFGKEIVKQESGSIINIASIAALGPTVGLQAYGAAKAGVVHLTKTHAIQFAPRKIRVNCICPGLLYTRAWEMLTARIKQSNPELANVSQRDIFKGIVARETPLTEEQTPEDIGNLAVFYASDNARMITGAVVAVDGGNSVK